MTLDDSELLSQTAAWVAASNVLSVDLGLDPEEALRRAEDFLQLLRKGAKPEAELSDSVLDVLRGACVLLSEAEEAHAEDTLKDAEALFEFISGATWPDQDFEERAEVIRSCAFTGWRAARRARALGTSASWFRRFSELIAVDSVSCLWLDQIRSAVAPTSPDDQAQLEQSEALLEICAFLREQLDTSPLLVVDRASSVYRFIDESNLPVGCFDERDYFLGEMALLAGTAYRQLSRRRDARAWFDRAEAALGRTANSVGDLLRLSYQRLALRLEERQPDVVLEFAPAVGKSLAKLGMREDALKCRFLGIVALAEGGRVADAVEAAGEICKEAENIGSERLLAHAYVNLAHYAGLLGDSIRMLDAFEKAVPVLTRLGDHIGLAKARWGMGNLFRTQGRASAAIEAFRSCAREFESLGMVADVASLHLAVADLLLETGQEREATREIRAALPIIDELEMVPERRVALSLLRESLRQQKINRQALRDLEGYFSDAKE